jgi:hypothetical protein
MDALYYKAQLTDKMLIYEDENVQFGCIRTVSKEWMSATIKIFVGNKS